MDSCFGNTLQGLRIGQCNLYRCSPSVFSIVSTKFTWIGIDEFYNLVRNSWCFSVFAENLGENELQKIFSEFFVHFFSAGAVWCRESVHPISKFGLTKAVALLVELKT